MSKGPPIEAFKGLLEALNSSSRYRDDLLNIDHNFFDSMVNHISSELHIK